MAGRADDRASPRLIVGGGGRNLELSGRDRVHVMFAGTTLVTAKQGEAAAAASNAGVPPTPDGTPAAGTEE